MSDKTFENSDLNKVNPVTIRNLALSIGVLMAVVIVGMLLQPIIADPSGEAATGTALAIFPVEEAERFSPEWYERHLAESGAAVPLMGLSIFPVEEAERYSAENYVIPQLGSETAGSIELAISPVNEAERFSPEWYARHLAESGAAAPAVRLALFPIEEAERYSSEQYARVRAGGEVSKTGLAVSPIEEAERFTYEWYQWRMKATTP